MVKRAPAFLFTALVAAAGCGGGSDNTQVTPTPDMAMPPAPPDMTFDPGPYPPAPYGTKVGSTMYDVTAKGYPLTPKQTDATALTLQDVSLDIARKNPQCKCLMVAISAIWCPPCNQEQQALIDEVNSNPNFCIVNVLVEGATKGVRATNEDLLTWNGRYMQNFPLIGYNLQSYLHLPMPDALPTNVIVKPSTMEILDINQGFDANNPQMEFDAAMALCTQ